MWSPCYTLFVLISFCLPYEKKNSHFNSNLVLSIIHIKSKALINLLLLPIITSLIRFNLARFVLLCCAGYGYIVSVYFDVFFIFMGFVYVCREGIYPVVV